MRAERPRGLWAQLSGSERDRLFEAIGYAEGAQKPEKPKQYIGKDQASSSGNCEDWSTDKEVCVSWVSHKTFFCRWTSQMTTTRLDRLVVLVTALTDMAAFTEHKLNATLVNCSVSMLSDTGEVLASHLTHLLVSLETRPAAAAYKVSLRIESAVIEGASLEHHLVPLITANVNSGETAWEARQNLH